MPAIVGPSGSGKSTVVNMIPRLYDVLGGSVTIAGVDVRDFDLKYLRRCIGSQILADIRAAMKGAGYERISLGCVKEDTDAVSFWESCGFKPTGEEKIEGKHTVAVFSLNL